VSVEYVGYGIIIDDIMFPMGRTQLGVLGGGGPQTAWGMAAALGSGEKVGIVAGIGSDLEREVLVPMTAAGINMDGVRVTDLPTPRSWQIVKSNGDRRHTWRVPVQSVASQLERGWDVLPASYQGARVFHWGIHPGDAAIDIGWARKLHEMGKIVSFETFIPPPNALTDAELRELLNVCTVFSPNWYEAVGITRLSDNKLIVKRFYDAGCKILVLRRGEEGADVWDFTQEKGVRVQPVRTKVVDVVGAGNTFTGAMLARWDDGIEEATSHASAAASYMLEQVGMPTRLPDATDYARRLDEARATIQVTTLDQVK
jgi:cytidine kinase